MGPDGGGRERQELATESLRAGGATDHGAGSREGQRLGAYRLGRRLGVGGMGEVCLGERADGAYQQLVAIKLIRADGYTAQREERFLAERQALATLSHPYIARLIDGGTGSDGGPFLVMEYVAGQPIDEYCAARALGVRERLALFCRVCEAVEHAHRHLIVHRDIKPSNILVGADGTPKLLDFGIAKLLGEAAGGNATLTRAGLPMTLAYASPEQLSGGAITTVTDVYALGVLLFRLLTGRHPYEIEDRDLTTVVREICDREPRLASQAVAQLGPGQGAPPGGSRALASKLRGDLDLIVARALRKSPEQRHASVAEFAADIERHLEGRPVRSRSNALAYRAGRFARRHRAAVTAGGLILLSLLGGLAATAWQAKRAARERDRARAEAAKASQMNAFLTSVLAAADPMSGEGRTVTVVQALARASERLSRDLAGQPDVEAGLRSTLGQTYLGLGLAPEGEREERRALALLSGHPGHSAADEALVRYRLAQALTSEGRWDAAEVELRAVLALPATGDPDGLDRASVLDELMITYQNRGRFKEAIATGRQALDLYRQRPGSGRELASLLNDLAICLGNDGQVREAEAMHRQAVDESQRAFGGSHPQTAEAQANLAGILDGQGRFDEAEPLYRQSVATLEAKLGERHVLFIRTLTSYANMLWLAHRYADAEPPARRALALARASLGGEHYVVAYAENVLGGVLLDAGRANDAEPHVRAALEMRRRSLPAGHWLIASARSNLGAVFLAEGRLGEARRELEAAYADLVRTVGPQHDRTRAARERLDRLAALEAGTPR